MGRSIYNVFQSRQNPRGVGHAGNRKTHDRGAPDADTRRSCPGGAFRRGGFHSPSAGAAAAGRAGFPYPAPAPRSNAAFFLQRAAPLRAVSPARPGRGPHTARARDIRCTGARRPAGTPMLPAPSAPGCSRRGVPAAAAPSRKLSGLFLRQAWSHRAHRSGYGQTPAVRCRPRRARADQS